MYTARFMWVCSIREDYVTVIFVYTISTVHNPDRQTLLKTCWFRWLELVYQSIYAKTEEKGLVLKEHEPVRIQYNPTATCSSRTRSNDKKWTNMKIMPNTKIQIITTTFKVQESVEGLNHLYRLCNSDIHVHNIYGTEPRQTTL